MSVFSTFKGIRGILGVASMHHKYTTMITRSTEKRVEILTFWKKHGYAATHDAYKVSERTLFAWQSRLRAG